MTNTDSGPTRNEVKLRLPANLIAGIDERREVLGISRNQWIENMVHWALDHTVLIQQRDEALAAQASKPKKPKTNMPAWAASNGKWGEGKNPIKGATGRDEQ